MKKIIVLLGCFLVFAGSMTAKEKKKAVKDSLTFTVIKENPITSVKNQNRSGTCWAFSSLGFFEAELLRTQHKEYNLCESFLVENTYLDRAVAAVRLHGDISFSQGGSFYDAVYCLKHYGMCPEEAMPRPGSLYGDTLYNHNELDKVTSAYVGALAKGTFKTLSPVWKKGLEGIYQAYIGKLPENFTYEGKTYTPKSFVAECLQLNMDDYVCLTSFSHHPYYSQFAIEVQDNWRWALNYNLPLDEFMEVMDHAVRQGYTFAWGADVSEPSFRKHEVVLMPKDSKVSDKSGSDQARWQGDAENQYLVKNAQNEVEVTPEMRQKAFDNWETTDDHGMLIYGLVKDNKGKEYFMMKNSWGDYNKYHGICYISKAYVAYETMNILINKHAIPAEIAKKLHLTL